MKKNLEDIIALGLCTYQAGIDRDSDGYGYLVEQQPSKPCQKICDYCRGQAAYIAEMIRENGSINEQAHDAGNVIPACFGDDRRS